MEDHPGSAAQGGALAEALARCVGARIDAAHANPATGLVALAVYDGTRRVLGAGIGPRVAGAGILPRLPRLRAGASHPLVAAMRAHLVGRRVLAIEVRSDGIVVVAGGGDAVMVENDRGSAEAAPRLEVAAPEPGLGLAAAEPGLVPAAVPEPGLGLAAAEPGLGPVVPPPRLGSSPGARLELAPGRRGEARLLDAAGHLILRWPPQGGAPPAAIAYPADPLAAGAALVEASDDAAAGQEKAALARAVKARRAALERRAEAVRGDLGRLGSVARLQKTGQLLLAQAARVPRGAAKALLDDWETGGKIEVALDPSRPAKAQAEVFFAKARRYQRGEAVMRARLAETERALSAIAALEADVAAAEARPESLDPLAQRARSLGVSRAELAGAGEPGTSGARAPGAGRPAPRRPFHAYRSASGAAILVGRGAEDNDALTTKHARPHDLWLHAKGVTGSHVVVPLAKGASCPADVLVDAATLAAHFSDARGEAVCEVSYVQRRYVRKPRGAAPGAVVFDREKVIAVRIEGDRLSRLLATKEEG
ncbi:NFACT RNA binding domain-containing protein [Sorangium atrum]|uniref:NFACT RNA binding domain-containing protein n=1 Tax=Sorangium atrum TaxID=2995308 RepID=A0ABT5BV61_9BACT|nr:NFACT RNA binding domain-containing protein [Sorangium aterium]MDC0677414.1 NFACT RNA binding domain-containing protein [Sorangium aterium]